MLKRLLMGALPPGVVARMRVRSAPPLALRVLRAETGTWTARHVAGERFDPPAFARQIEIETAAAATERLGKQPLWSGYAGLRDQPHATDANAQRSSEEVRTGTSVGLFYAWLVRERRPATIVEFGTAFGISGMYWLAALEANAQGHLYTFEPNTTWADIARRNLASIGTRFTLTQGTFEGNVGVLDGAAARIDLAFIDAIHTSAFVLPQMELVLARAARLRRHRLLRRHAPVLASRRRGSPVRVRLRDSPQRRRRAALRFSGSRSSRNSDCTRRPLAPAALRCRLR